MLSAAVSDMSYSDKGPSTDSSPLRLGQALSRPVSGGGVGAVTGASVGAGVISGRDWVPMETRGLGGEVSNLWGKFLCVYMNVNFESSIIYL